MICGDLLEAELVLYGTFGRNLSVRNSPGGEERINDLAQAWIDGDRDTVLDHVRAHEERVRLRALEKTDREKILELRRAGCTKVEIARTLRVAAACVARECRGLPQVRRARKVNTTEIFRLRSLGYTQKQIAETLGLSRRSVIRAMKLARASRAYRRRAPQSAACAIA
jgi:DNA-binding CsgD family transcriptional regulator